jgi:GT2 family glycosyltransferase
VKTFESTPSATPPVSRVDGKFLAVNGRRFLVKGVSYGTFAPDENGGQFPATARIDQDFGLMAESGFNTVRTYTLPPDDVLDAAARHGLKIMAGLAWPQHIPFLDDRRATRQIRRDAVDAVRRLAAHEATLLVAVGNEIPAGIVRWHGHRRIERFLRELYDDIKSAAPAALLTYCNFPPTEYLDLECFDVCAFNVYLHREADLRAYLARLQHIAGARPLLLAEAGADSIREGLDGQARLTAMQVRAAFAEGACGAVAYSWTDEWWRGGRAVDDWAFGLVDEERQPKPALAAVREVFAEAPFSARERAQWPKVSVVVCAYNAADTIDDCLSSLAKLTYPQFEVIVVNDGSHDGTGEIAKRYAGVQVIDIPNGGLSAARNVGLTAATGEIVAYTDADVRVDADWLTYLVQPMLTSDVAGSGGPNVVPPDDPWIAQCVARAPGWPTHVMLDDRIAEHVPGCNMAFRRDALLSIDGFNPVYRRAGDDVDVCWRIQAKGLRIGFAPSALVWHHARCTVGAYSRQQEGYGEGEAWLDVHHPEKFLGGEVLWQGHIYSPLPFLRSATGRNVNTGVWGTAAFPAIYSTRIRPWHFVPHTPVWMAVSLLLLVAGGAGALMGMEAAFLLLGAGLVGWLTTGLRCLIFAWRSDLGEMSWAAQTRTPGRRLHRAMIAWLHLWQPLARFRGNLRGMAVLDEVAGPHVFRHQWKTPAPSLQDARTAARLLTGTRTEQSFWSETPASGVAMLTELVGVLRASRPAQLIHVDEGWRPDQDLSLAVGRWGWLHVRTLVEDHARGCSLLRVRAHLRPSFVGSVQVLTLALLLGAGMSAAMALSRPAMSLLMSLLGVGAIAARSAWQLTRASAALDWAIAHVTRGAGMQLLPTPVEPAPSLGAAETTLSQG